MLRTILIFFLTSVVLTDVLPQSQPLDSLEVIIAKDLRDSAHVQALIRLMQTYRGKDNQKAIYYAKEIIKLPENSQSVWTAKANIVLGLIYSDLGSYDSASLWFKEAQKTILLYPNDQNLQSVFYNGMGLFYKKQGDNKKALQYYMLVDKLGEAGMGKENLAGNHLNIANVYNRMGNGRAAIQYLYKALPIFESLDNEKGMSYCYNNLGLLLKQQNNLKQAGLYLQKSLKLKEKNGDLKGIANTNNELALLFMGLNDYEKSLEHIERTIQLSNQLGIKELLTSALLNKGKIYRLQNKLDLASAVLTEAKALAETHPSHYQLSYVQAEIGKIYTELQKNEMAITQLLSGIREAEKSSNMEAQVNAHLFLSEAYSRNRQYKEALEHYQHYHWLEDSARGKKIKLDYKALETQYEVEKKNSEIALLKKDQELQARTVERQRAMQTGIGIAFISVIIISFLLINRYRLLNRSKRLLEIERVRNTIARDLHDDIGSTLSSINIVSQLAMKENTSNGSAINHFKRIGEQSSAIMESMSDIVWSINPNNDSLPMMAAKMKEFTAEILEPKNIMYTFGGEDTLNGEILEVEKRKNIFLIFKEAVNNAAKYSEGSLVAISLIQTEKTLQLKVSDNGKGFDPGQCRNGNGLRNIRQRALAISGILEINTQPGEGTTLDLQVPVT